MPDVRRDLTGTVVVVTGATDGMGRVAAEWLAARGASVCMLARNRQKIMTFLDALGNPSTVTAVIGDLSSLQAVRDLAAQVRATFDRVDVLINNAGVMKRAFERSADGFEVSVAVNHLAVHALTIGLLDRLLAAPAGRIVNVNSDYHRAPLRGRGLVTVEFDTWRRDRCYDTFLAYSRSKLASLMAGYVLARRLEATPVTLNALHPGFIRTNLSREFSPLIAASFHLLFSAPPQTGAHAILNAALSPAFDGRTGLYIDKLTPVASSRVSKQRDLQERVWEETVQATGLDY